LLEHVSVRRAAGRGVLPWLASAGVVLASLALAGPSWTRLAQPVYHSAHARVVVLDLSRSMDAADLEPSRLARARFKLADLLERARDGQTGLVVYAGEAFAVAPLTDDVATLTHLLPVLTTDLMPVHGSRADLGLELAGQLLDGAGARAADIVLVSDGVDEPRAAAAAAALADEGHRVSVLAVGSGEGAPIPLPGGGFLKDRDGDIVIPGLDAAGLRAVARAGRGVLTNLTSDDSDLRLLLRDRKPAGDEARPAARTTVRWRDGGPWLLLALLPMAAAAFRRGWLLLVIALVLPGARDARAFELEHLWLRPDQRAARALANDAPAEAARSAPDALWRAPAKYRAGDYDAAAREYQRIEGADGRYNLGNALARAGQLREALQAYDEALERDPEMADARHNREIVEQLLQAQPPTAPQPGATGTPSPEGTEGERRRSGAGAGAGAPASGLDRMGEARRENEASAAGPPPGEPNSARDRTPSTGDGDAQDGRAGTPQRAPARDPGDGESRETDAEAQQALEQWMRRVPDDPGGLLRRKFALEHRRRGSASNGGTQAW
jgi:Ca-activated chloride channel family protein